MTHRAKSPPATLADLPSNAVLPLAPLSTDRLRAWAADAGHRFVHADLSACAGKKPLLKAIGTAFAFPGWFGANLDALFDCLTDLPDDAPAPGWVVVLEHLTGVARLDEEQRAALLDVFRDAAAALADRKVPLRVFYS
jgi:RNAse (barnase) inhibitor barstar